MSKTSLDDNAKDVYQTCSDDFYHGSRSLATLGIGKVRSQAQLENPLLSALKHLHLHNAHSFLGLGGCFSQLSDQRFQTLRGDLVFVVNYDRLRAGLD